MDILGVGGWELVAILLIMLVVAGPKRMIQWSYTLGKYVAQLRKMWAETAQMLQKEFDEAGVDVQVPKNIPTRGDINREISRALTPVTKPFQESLAATQKELDSAKKAVTISTEPLTKTPTPPAAPAETTPPTPTTPVETTAPPAPETPPTITPPLPVEEKPAPSSNGKPDFGTWSQKNEGSS